MKNIFYTGILLIALGFTSCNDFFDAVPGEQYDLAGTFANKSRTEQYLNNVYSYVPGETYERFFNQAHAGIWTGGSIEANITWSWHQTNEWTSGMTYASSSWINFWFIEYYKAIAKASTFIAYVDKCAEANENERKVWKAQARALRAYYYFLLFRAYGPTVLLGEDPLPLDTPLEELLKERNSVDECINFITSEFDLAAADLPTRYNGANLGRFDKGACKAFKAKALLYAASPLFNCNPDYANVKNRDGKQLFPQDNSQEQAKWEKARAAYKEFFDTFVPGTYSLFEVRNGAAIDFYESCRQVTSGLNYSDANKEVIFLRLLDTGLHTYEITPYHGHVDNGEVKGGLGFGTTQEMVDMFFTDKGLRIVDDPDYTEYTGVPPASLYGAAADYNNPQDQNVTFFKANSNQTLKQWANREARFYVNITFNGSTWVNDATNFGKITTELTVNGNSGYNRAGHDAPFEGYGVRKMAPKNGVGGSSQHAANLLRLADMYLGYAEVLSACGDFATAMTYVNLVRARAGVPGYGNGGGTDANGLAYIAYPSNRSDVDKRIRRERLIELAYEWNHYFDVRRWKVADMAIGDDWIYPAYHRGGEGGEIHGMNSRADAPNFFEKVVTETRVFEKKHYLFPIPDADIRRNTNMVQNYGWSEE
jgi:hypothetical protein